MIKPRTVFLPVILSVFFYGCVQNIHNDPVSRQQAIFSDHESTAEHTNISNAIGNKTQNTLTKNDAPTPSDASDLTASSEKSDNENQNHSIGDSDASESKTSVLSNGSDSDSKIQAAEKSSHGDKTQSILDEALDFCQESQDFWQKGELENALDALDHAYALILKIDADDNAKLIQQKEDLRFMISKRILEIYASRHIVVKGNHNAIPLVMNKHVQKEIDNFAKYNEKKFFVKAYQRSGKYRPLIVPMLKAAGIPVELSWLPLIESGFKVNALSKARALGLWQFIPSTGYKFGLNRDTYIDERIDPIKSTNAAIAYLKELHQIFGDWSTVLAAYNCGEGQVLKVIRTQNINYLDNFWDLYERLPRETARYVPRFMAALYIINNPEKYGLDAVSIDKPLQFDIVTVSKQVHLKNIANAIDVPEQELCELNPELRYKILPHGNYPLRIPKGKADILLASLDDIPVSYPPRPAYVYHRIRRGESLSTIARRYHTSVSKIMWANNLHRSRYIVAGRKLKIPLRGMTTYVPHESGNTNLPSTHVVRSGDSLWIIAKRYGTTTKKIRELNNLTTTRLHIGQVLKISEDQDKDMSSIDFKTYVVKRGDSPFDIAQGHKMSLNRFLRINALTPDSTIYPGQKLQIEQQ
ncbi:MAG: LysM peptidoglycan-binding domain-containing protein [Desulfobacterales bacterium]|nr:LysM peptidoglycan-binding domain-containing protein [Desulfobacterales bacterium]